jgi:hypothetical protein
MNATSPDVCGIAEDSAVTAPRPERGSTSPRLALGAEGNLYIADQGHNRVRHVDTDGRIGTMAAWPNASPATR